MIIWSMTQRLILAITSKNLVFHDAYTQLDSRTLLNEDGVGGERHAVQLKDGSWEEID